MLKDNRFWIIVAFILGVVVDYFSRWLYDRLSRPEIEIPQDDKDIWWETFSNANLFYMQSGNIIMFKQEHQEKVSLLKTDQETHNMAIGYKDVTVRVYRLKVSNKGKRAAENVAGTVEFKTGFQNERRICWYEGNHPTITLNAKDHSFLDVYGVLLEEPGAICMPTENGWSKLHTIALAEKTELCLRATAGNAQPCSIKFLIDPKNECRPHWS